VLTLHHRLEERVIGQSHALELISKSIRTSRARLADPRKPIGVFLLVGTSGVGKTETAIALAELLYGGTQNMTTINMSEFKEEHKVSTLMGSPPGYVGYGEGGVLTEAVRRKPYSVILLDEVEKAHRGVQDVFLQVFDKGNMRDSEGRDIDFRNTVVLMTSNAGARLIAELCADPDACPDPEALREKIYPELRRRFKTEFLGRATIVPYYPLTDAVLERIVQLQLNKVVRRIQETYGAQVHVAPEVAPAIVSRCREGSAGARAVESIINHTLLPELASLVLGRLGVGAEIGGVRIGFESGTFLISDDSC